ncbi:MAG: hypothetical protein ACREIA_10325 [Opitutaceae bacterium]
MTPTRKQDHSPCLRMRGMRMSLDPFVQTTPLIYIRRGLFVATIAAVLYFFKGQRLTFITVLRPHPAGGFAEEMLSDVSVLKNERDDGRTLGLQFTLGGERVTVGLKLDQTIGLTNLRGRPMFDATTGAVAYGPLRKGPFHLPRMQWYCGRLVEESRAGQG